MMSRHTMLAATLALAATLCAAAQPAAAQDHPLAKPSRDVMVEYHILNVQPGDHRSDTVRMYFTDGGMRLRIEPVGQPGYSIVDRSAHRMLLVMEPQHVYVEVAYDPNRIMTFDATDATFRRIGHDTVAGLGCTVYNVARQGRESQVCLTDDGVMLRANSENPGQANGGMEAVSVTYAPQPASLFVPPPGYQQMDIATMAHGMMAPPSK
ncbi:MAG TPA: DUF4412 domain-containing protein [Acetobacteraceae bacterium]|nr:DUF4412 domain-containing protein [Acetobacteraceae bacterium]